MFLVVKASDDYWYDFTDETNVIKLKEKYGDFVFKMNDYTDEPESLVTFWQGMTLKDAKKLNKCKYKILIYDSYIE